MMHQPVDYDDTRFYAADTLLILKSDATCGVLGALCAARTGAGALLAVDDHTGCLDRRDDPPAPQRRGTHRELRTGAE